MQKWEYTIRRLYRIQDTGETHWNDDNPLELLDRLNELGEEGWELVAAYYEQDSFCYSYIFKRPKE